MELVCRCVVFFLYSFPSDIESCRNSVQKCVFAKGTIESERKKRACSRRKLRGGKDRAVDRCVGFVARMEST